MPLPPLGKMLRYKTGYVQGEFTGKFMGIVYFTEGKGGRKRGTGKGAA